MASISKRGIQGLKRIGDLYLPGNDEFPPYSLVAGVDKLRDLTRYAPSEDIQLLNWVLILFSFMPRFVLRGLVNRMAQAEKSGAEDTISITLRQLDTGLRGLIMSTYYGEFTRSTFTGKKPSELIDYKITRIEK